MLQVTTITTTVFIDSLQKIYCLFTSFHTSIKS